MEKFIPLGSIVLLNDGVKKLMIIARAITIKNGDEEFYFDYGAVFYPEGLIGDELAYFNKDDIAKVVAEGYVDSDEEQMINNIDIYLSKLSGVKKGNVKDWKEQ